MLSVLIISKLYSVIRKQHKTKRAVWFISCINNASCVFSIGKIMQQEVIHLILKLCIHSVSIGIKI